MRWVAAWACVALACDRSDRARIRKDIPVELRTRCWRVATACVLLAFSGLLQGCGSQGVTEFQLYSKAFDAQYEQGDNILNAVARAERTVFLRRFRRGEIVKPFEPDKAAYFVDSVDPPITGSIRASLKSLKSFNDVLGALANGEAAEALVSRAGTFVSNVVGAVAAAEVASASFGIAGPGAVKGADALVSNTAKLLTDINPILTQLATYASREEFRRLLVRTYPTMKELLLTLRDGTPAMFLMLERSRVQRGSERVSGMSKEREAALEKDRELLAGWVLLLDKTLAAMQTAVVAAMSDAPPATIASLSEVSVELRVLAEKVKSIRSR